MLKSLIYANYDWDDNLLYMPTNIIYFAKDPSNKIQEIAVTTEGFAHTRSAVGTTNFILKFINKNGLYIQTNENLADAIEIDLLDYQIIYQNEQSFREFRDHESIDFFMDHLKQAVEEKKFGPSFKDFQEHCSSFKDAQNIKIITARGQSPSTIYQGLKYLKEQGLIKFIPNIDNIYPVSYNGPEMSDEFKAAASNPQEAKMKVLTKVLDHMHENHPGSCFGFSDDDKKTFEYTEKFISQEIKKNRWSNIEINLYFTGNKIKERKILLKVQSNVA